MGNKQSAADASPQGSPSAAEGTSSQKGSRNGSRRSSVFGNEGPTEQGLTVSYTPEQLREMWRAFNTTKKKTACPPDMPFKMFAKFLRKHYAGLDESMLQRILFAFYDEDASSVSFHEFASTLSVLEGKSPTDKLKYVFRIYDDDADGFIGEEEVKEVLDQMVSAALYLGHDTTEMREFFEKVLQMIDQNQDGRISLEEWVSGGINSVALLQLLGLDTSDFNPHNIREGEHEWRIKHFRSGYMCNACHTHISGRRLLICNVCKSVCHQQCADAAQGCRGSYVDKAIVGMKPEHHWVDGNVQERCAHCNKMVKSKAAMKGSTCSWCKQVVHLECRPSFEKVCDLGKYADIILPATSFSYLDPTQPKARTSRGTLETLQSNVFRERVGTINRLPQLPLRIVPNPDFSGGTPFLILVNSRSGANQGLAVMRACRYILNPRQVFDLNEVGPEPGLRLFAAAHRARVICCGGDGTVGWVLSALDKLCAEGVYSRKRLPAIGTIPLGTGNDLARCLNWGGGFTGEDVGKLLLQLADAQVVQLDRWSLKITPEDAAAETDDIPLSIINNYFSVGVDASIALRFHHERENHPNRFKSRMKNKFFYAQYGAEEALHRTCADLNQDIEIVVDGIPVKLPTLAGIAILNIPSMYGGSNLWGTHKGKRWVEQHIGDNLIEIVGIYGALHAAQVKGGLRQSAKRIAQGRVIEIKTKKMLPMQVDGEPWMQSACTIKISHHNQMPMLRKGGRGQSQGFFQQGGGVERASIVHGKARLQRKGSAPAVMDTLEEEPEIVDEAEAATVGAATPVSTDRPPVVRSDSQVSATAPF